MTKFTRTFDSRSPAGEFKEAKRAARVLGFKPVKFQFDGAWENDNGLSVFPSGFTDVMKVGNKYWYAVIDGETVPIKPTRSRTSGRGEVTVTFSDQ